MQFEEIERTERELQIELRKSAQVRRDIAIRYGTGLMPVLNRVARRFPYAEVWEMVWNQLEQYPPKISARGYIPKVVETAAHELGYFAIRVSPPRTGA
jgi:hypothetical protein